MELFIAIAFIVVLWLIGNVIVGDRASYGCGWLAGPVGLSVLSIASNFLYFAVGLSTRCIQAITLIAALLCFIVLLYRRPTRCDLQRCFLMIAVFVVLVLPAYIGGQSYYVFRGNVGDHFNYIDQGLTFYGNRSSHYIDVLPVALIKNEIWVHGLRLLEIRPAVGLVFALFLPNGQGDIHLLAFLYVTVLWALALPALCFAWGWLNRGSQSMTVGRKVLLMLVPLGYVVGFWGQYIFDISAWSQIASLPILVAFVFVVADVISSSNIESAITPHEMRSKSALAGLLCAGGFLLYPESAVVQYCVMGATFACLFIAHRKLPTLDASVRLAVSCVISLSIAIAPNIRASLFAAIGQIKFGAKPTPPQWSNYFDGYWQGLHGYSSSAGRILNFLLAVNGLYFTTPDYSADLSIRFLWIAASLCLAFFCVFCVIKITIVALRDRCVAGFLGVYCLISFIVIAWLYMNGAIWSAGKALSYLSPFLYLAVCFGAFQVRPNFVRKLADWRGSSVYYQGFLIAFIFLQFYFGIQRIEKSADGAMGIGLDDGIYPSVQRPLKNDYMWTLDFSPLRQCQGIHISGNPGPVYMEYVKEKLQYAGLPFYSDVMVTSDFGVGQDVGFQNPIKVDCSIFMRDGQLGRWRAESSLMPFYGEIDLSKRPQWVGFDGFAPVEGGNWTILPVAKIILPGILPAKFAIDFTVTSVFGRNAEDPVLIRIGNQQRPLRISGPGVYTAHFADATDADAIDIVIPHPESPKSLGMSEDARALGVAVSSVTVRHE
jgi:hypothetical protein